MSYIPATSASYFGHYESHKYLKFLTLCGRGTRRSESILSIFSPDQRLNHISAVFFDRPFVVETPKEVGPFCHLRTRYTRFYNIFIRLKWRAKMDNIGPHLLYSTPQYDNILNKNFPFKVGNQCLIFYKFSRPNIFVYIRGRERRKCRSNIYGHMV